jgi:hypothetical protein
MSANLTTLVDRALEEHPECPAVNALASELFRRGLITTRYPAEIRVCRDCGHPIDTGGQDDCRCPDEEA